MENIIKDLTKYRLKVERDGKSVMDVPGILCLPGLLAMPRLSIVGIVAAPLLGCKIRLESEDGKEVDIEKTVREAAETVADTASTAAKTVKEEIEKAWQAMSAEDEPETDDAEAQEDVTAQDAAEEEADTKDTEAREDASAQDAAEDIVEDPEAQEADDVPTIHVNPDDSAQE